MLHLLQGQMGDRAKAVNWGSIPPQNEEKCTQKPQETDVEKENMQTNPWANKENNRRIGGWEEVLGNILRLWRITGGLLKSFPPYNPTATAVTTKLIISPKPHPSLHQEPWVLTPIVWHQGIPCFHHPAEKKEELFLMAQNHKVHTEVQ